MKRFLKTVLSVILVLSILIVPVVISADDSTLGTYENPYQLKTTSTHFTVTVDAESEAWVQVDDCIGSTLNVVSATTSDYMIVYCRQPNYPETTSGSNTLSVTMVNGADMFSIYNSGTTSVEIYMTLTAGSGMIEQGTVDNPEEVTLSKNMFGGFGASVTKDLAAGNQGYYYKTVAPDDGIITVNVGAFDADYNNVGWFYYINNETTYVYGDYHWSDDEEPIFYDSVKVSKDDVVVVFVATYDPADQWSNPAGTVSCDFSFDAVGTWNNPKEITAGSHVAALESNSMGYYYTWTAPEAGVATVAMDTANNPNGWQYSVNGEKVDGSYIYGDTHWCDDDPLVASETITVSAGDKLTISVNTYDPDNAFGAPEGDVNWSLTFVPGEGGDDGSDDGNDDGTDDGGNDDGNGDDTGDITYINSEAPLAIGTGSYAMIDGYTYTIFAFEPTEVGKYTVSTTDGVIGIVSYNGMWVSTEPTDDTVKDNTLVWECSGVGQSIWVAVKSDVENVNISISKEDIVVDNIPFTTYINKHTPAAFTFTGDADALEYVDTFDATVDTAVLGSDGYYHLNSATGPILYVDLDDSMMNLVDAMSYGQLKDIVMDGETIISKTDYNEAFGAYSNCADKTTGLYPLTEDLITIYKAVGNFQGWFGADGWVGGELEDAWMFACYYIPADGGSSNNNNNNNNNNNFGNSDFTDNNFGTGTPVGNGSQTQSGKPVTGTQTGKPVTGTQTGKPVSGTQVGAAQTYDPFIINLAVLAMSGLGVVATRKTKKK